MRAAKPISQERASGRLCGAGYLLMTRRDPRRDMSRNSNLHEFRRLTKSYPTLFIGWLTYPGQSWFDLRPKEAVPTYYAAVPQLPLLEVDHRGAYTG